jgi:hypothetical protein
MFNTFKEICHGQLTRKYTASPGPKCIDYRFVSWFTQKDNNIDIRVSAANGIRKVETTFRFRVESVANNNEINFARCQRLQKIGLLNRGGLASRVRHNRAR